MSQIDSTERFIEMFGAAFDRAHRRTDGTDRPSERVRNRVLSDISRAKKRSETADPSAFGSDYVSRPSLVMEERRSGMEMALSTPVRNGSRPRSHWWSLVVAGIAVVLVAATLRMTLPPAAPGSDRSDLALVAQLATPASSACMAEPLTAEEVMDMVKNPLLGYDRMNPPLGDPANYVAGATDIRGQLMDRSPYPDWLDDASQFVALSPDVGIPVSEVKAAADQFWTCMLYGSSYQVWGLIAPEFVQAEILRYYPIFRTEDEVMATIQRLGPLPYSANGNSVFTTLGAKDGGNLVLQSQPGDEGIWARDSDGYFQGKIAVVELAPVDSDDAFDPRPRHYLMQRIGENQWIVMGVDWQTVSP